MYGLEHVKIRLQTASAGITVDRWYEQTLQTTGAGNYSLANYHNAYNVYCNYWDNQTYTADQMAIQRPTIGRTDPAPFFLGGAGYERRVHFPVDDCLEWQRRDGKSFIHDYRGRLLRDAEL